MICVSRTMGKPNAEAEMARDGLRCTLHFPSLAMIVLPIIDGEQPRMEASASGKNTIIVKDSHARYISHMCQISSSMVWRLDTDEDS